MLGAKWTSNFPEGGKAGCVAGWLGWRYMVVAGLFDDAGGDLGHRVEGK